jgi:hypothetical protein
MNNRRLPSEGSNKLKFFLNRQLESSCNVFRFLKRRALVTWFALAMACFAHVGYSQGTLAPLYLFTNGDGSITPYQSRQMLEAGQTYDITATPDAGYQFNSWEPVVIFIITQTNYDDTGNPVLPPHSVHGSMVLATNIYGADLEFTLQNVMDITSEGTNPSIIEAFGWQANFVPIPEPADAVITAYGFAVIAMARRRRWL